MDELNARIGEIARDHPDRTELIRIGSSRLGEPLWSLTVHGGPRQVVVVAAVHPADPWAG